MYSTIYIYIYIYYITVRENNILFQLIYIFDDYYKSFSKAIIIVFLKY